MLQDLRIFQEFLGEICGSSYEKMSTRSLLLVIFSAGPYALKRENIKIINFLQLLNKSSKWNFSSIDHPGDCFSKAE